MRLDWQAIAVALIVGAALAYVARRVWGRVRSMRGGARAVGVSACGNCPSGEGRPASVPRPDLIVQIGRTRAPRK